VQRRIIEIFFDRKTKKVKDIFEGGVKYENGYPKPDVGRYEPD